MKATVSAVIEKMMTGATLPGNSTVNLQEFEVPEPDHGQVLLETRASTICGSDIRAIYRKHTGKGAEGYINGTICGHEPAGIVARVGPGVKQFQVGDRALVYHISGCGICHNCRTGDLITDEFPLECAGEAYALMASGRCGKVAVTFPESKDC